MRRSNAVTVILAFGLASLIASCPDSLLAQQASTGVQGIVQQNANGNAVLPAVTGGLKPAINAGALSIGLDNFFTNTLSQSGGANINLFLGAPPAPSANNDFAIAVINGPGGIGGTGLSVSPQWGCPAPFSCSSHSPNSMMAYIQNVSVTSGPSFNLVNSVAGNWMTAFVEFATKGVSPTLRGGATASSNSISTSGNTLAGSTVIAAFSCLNAPCTAGPTVDSQGNRGIIVSAISFPGCSSAQCGQVVMVFGPTSAAGETVTINATGGSVFGTASILELAGITPASPNRPAASISASNNTFISGEQDPGPSIFTRNGGFSYQATFTATQTTPIPLWNITQHGVFQSCTVFTRVTAASGTTPTLDVYLQDSPDGIGWNDHIHLPQATAAGAWEGVTPLLTAGSLAAVASGATAVSNLALAAGSVVAGPVSNYGQLVLVVGGTTPSFTVSVGVNCN